MTDAERTEWRIRAAKAVGYYIKKTGSTYYLLHPNRPGYDNAAYEQILWDNIGRYFDPFESAEDCEALFVATIQKGRLILVWPSMKDYCKIGLTSSNVFGGEKQDFCSDNADPRLAYRESVVQACVRAFEAQEEAEIHRANDSAEGNVSPRK